MQNEIKKKLIYGEGNYNNYVLYCADQKIKRGTHMLLKHIVGSN